MKINLYKLVVFTLKVIPMLMAFIALCDTILSYFYIDVPALSYIGGCSFLTLVFIYIASYAFRFCEYHRIFLHYIVAVNIINWYDYNYVIPINLRGMLCIQASIVVIFMFIALYLHKREQSNKENNSKTITRNS